MTDIVERLRARATSENCRFNLQTQDYDLMHEAISEIEALRSLGKAAVGPSFAEAVKNVRHEAPDENV